MHIPMHIDDQISTLASQGLTARGIGRAVGVSKTTILRHFKKLGITPLTLSEARKTHSGPNKGRNFSKEHRQHIGDVQRGRKQSESLIAKRSAAMKVNASRGEKHYLWAGGNSRPTERRGAEYRKWRRLVLERDGGACVFCGSSVRVEADHIKPWATHPALRFDIDNGRALCRPCHKKTPSYGANLARSRINGTVVTLLAI